MMNKPGIWVAVFLNAFMLLLLGIVLSSLSSCATIATEQPSFPTGTTQAGALSAQPEETLAPDPLASPGTDYPPPVAYATYNPYPLDQLDPTEKALIAQKETNVAEMVMTMTAEPTGTPEQTLSPEQIAANPEEMKRMMKSEGAIMLEDNGQTFTYTVASRFFVFLDDQKYPVSSLDCKPNWVMGYISNGDFNGPDLYPKYYEADELGSCTLTDHDFAVKIVVVDLPTLTPGGP